MTMNSLVSDALTRVRNGLHANHASVVMPCSRFVKNVLDVLQREGYIGGIEEFEERPGVRFLRVALRYYQGAPVITKIKTVSKPGCRRYFSIGKLPKVNGGLGISILSTSKGVLSDAEARRMKVGGEVICNVF